MSNFEIKRNDLLPVFDCTLLDGDGEPVVLTGASSVRFIMSKGRTVVLDTPMEVDPDQDTNPGHVLYSWVAGDTDTKGEYKGEIEVTWGSGKKETFPTKNYLQILIGADLA